MNSTFFRWSICETKDGGIAIQSIAPDGGSNGIAIMAWRDDGLERELAQFIAAAPDMFAAIKRMVDNIDHWLETGEPATPNESKAIYEQLKSAMIDAAGEE